MSHHCITEKCEIDDNAVLKETRANGQVYYVVGNYDEVENTTILNEYIYDEETKKYSIEERGDFRYMSGSFFGIMLDDNVGQFDQYNENYNFSLHHISNNEFVIVICSDASMTETSQTSHYYFKDGRLTKIESNAVQRDLFVIGSCEFTYDTPDFEFDASEYTLAE